MRPVRVAALMERLTMARRLRQNDGCSRHRPSFGARYEKARNRPNTVPGTFTCTSEVLHVLRFEDDCNTHG